MLKIALGGGGVDLSLTPADGGKCTCTSSTSRSAHQGGRILVGPEGLRDGPVADGNPRLRVGSHVDEFMATVPRLRAEG